MQHRYNAEIVAGALLPDESKIIAKLLLEGVSDLELTHLLKVDNVLQKRSPGTAIRKAELIRKRFALVDESLLAVVANGSRQASIQALLVAAIKHNHLIGDFLLRIVKEKWRVFESKLKPNDWELFLKECEQVDDSVKAWKPSTRQKLGQVVKKCLVEAQYLESATKPYIKPVILLPEIQKYLFEHKETYVSDCMNIVS